MEFEVRKTGRLEPIFIDIHGEQAGEELELEVTLAVEASIERMAGAFYMDGSDSMRQAGNYGSEGFFGLGKKSNLVQDAMRVAVPYVTQKDANGRCRVAYWATGMDGKDIEGVGEMSAEQAVNAEFPGPRVFGNGTYLLPAVRDFTRYIEKLVKGGETVDAALAVVVTDGRFHDQDKVMEHVGEQLAPAIMRGGLPRTVFTLVGVGSQVDEEQLEELMHKATPEGYPHREIFCYALADTLDQLPTLVSHLLDENTPAFYGGAMIVAGGKTVATYEDMVPAVLTFRVPMDAHSFTLTASGQSYTQTFDVVLSDHNE